MDRLQVQIPLPAPFLFINRKIDFLLFKGELMMKIDQYSYNCGIMDCFSEMVRARVKKLALAHPFKTQLERSQYLDFVEKITKQYQINYYLDDDPLITDLFPYSLNRNTYNIIFYLDEKDIQAYQKLKERKNIAIKNNQYHVLRKEIAYQFGYLLNYDDKTIAAYIKQNNEKEDDQGK